MTVQELIKQLSKVKNKDFPVLFDCDTECLLFNIESVYVQNGKVLLGESERI